MLPTVDFFGHRVSRVILGDNPFSGHSYIERDISGDAMMDYYTGARVVDTLFRAQELGFTTGLMLASEFILRAWREYKNRGGTMNWIAQPYPAVPLPINLTQIMRYDPIAIYHQGTTTDNLTEAGEWGTLRDNVKRIADTGKPVGVCSHVPETIQRIEDEGWGVDFYMACLHNMRKRQQYQSRFITGASINFTFHGEDREEMLATIRAIPRPCIAFKVFAGGNWASAPGGVKQCFVETFSGVKPGDLACIGVFQRDKDQLGEDAAIAAEVLSNA